MDIVLVLFNVTIAIGLWVRVPWTVMACGIGIIALQIVPYTPFRQYFVTTPEQVFALHALVVTMAVLLGTLVGLVAAKR
jgi:hypothetical protein